MWQYILKILITAILVVLISESAKRWTLLGAIIASLPITSILAMIWLYIETGSTEKVGSLSSAIFWIVLPSFLFFVLLPVFFKWGWTFWPSLALSASITAGGYWLYIKLLAKIGIEIG